MKIVFLDRDGVINRFPGHGSYVTKIKDFRFVPGSLEAIRKLTEAGYKIFVISNQAGVGKGVFSPEKLKRIDAYMHKHVEKAGGEIQKSYYCTHRAEEGCKCRKPAIGLLKKALKSLNKTIAYAKHRFFIGDMPFDIKTGHTAGCKTIFVCSGGESQNNISQWSVKPDFIVDNLKAAVEVITQNENPSHSRNSRGRA